MKNLITDVRTPRGQVNYEEWHLKVLLAVNGKGVSSEQLTNIIDKSASSISKKAGQMGVSLARKRR